MDMSTAIKQVEDDIKNYSRPETLDFLADCRDTLYKARKIVAIMENGYWEEEIAKYIF